jgi:hypothetical protein
MAKSPASLRSFHLRHDLPLPASCIYSTSFPFSASSSGPARPLLTRAPNAHSLDARDVLDICAYLDQQLDVVSWYVTVNAGVISQSNVPLSQPISRVL